MQVLYFALVFVIALIQALVTAMWGLQIQTAEGLTIRVINNVSKRMEVKPRFHEAFQKEGCPDAFPYRQKVFKTLAGSLPCLLVSPR